MEAERTVPIKPFAVAITGASGSLYGLRFVRAITELGHPIALTISEAARIVMHEELGIEIPDLKDPASKKVILEIFNRGSPMKALGDDSLISYYPYSDLTAPIASGSYPTRGMIVIPASTTCFSKIAAGISDTLIERAAECTIKEGRKLVLVPRETPLSALHLEHLLKLARIGVRIVPAIPGFYSGAQKIEELIDFVVGKALDQLDVEHMLYARWTGSRAKEDKWTEKLK